MFGGVLTPQKLEIFEFIFKNLQEVCKKFCEKKEKVEDFLQNPLAIRTFNNTEEVDKKLEIFEKLQLFQ